MPFPPVPQIPAGMTLREFGEKVVRWGTGDDTARKRISTLTRKELTDNRVTLEMVQNWAKFYRTVKKLTPENPSAEGRAELMEYAASLLK